jgi:hypothetical protein
MVVLAVLTAIVAFFYMLFKNPKLLFKCMGFLLLIPKLILAEMVKQQKR